MTYLEQYMQERPECTETYILDDLCVKCYYKNQDIESICCCNSTCSECWNREISEEPQEQPTGTPTQPQILDSGNREEDTRKRYLKMQSIAYAQTAKNSMANRKIVFL